jgi:hypothetical protein
MNLYDDNSSLAATTAKFDLDHTQRRWLQIERENQQLRQELQDAYRRIQQLEAKVLAVENPRCTSSAASSGGACSVTSSVTTAITGSALADLGRRRDQQRCSSAASTGGACSVTSSVTTAITGSALADLGRRRDQQRYGETTSPVLRLCDHKLNLADLQSPVELSSRTASDLTLASHESLSTILPPLLFPSFSSSSSSTSSFHSSNPWNGSEEDTPATGWRQNLLRNVAKRYLERIDSSDSQEMVAM